MKIRRQYIDAPVVPKLSAPRKWLYAMLGVFLSLPVYLLACLSGPPGIAFRRQCMQWGISLLRKRPIGNIHHCFNLLFNPMDSTRYFEFGVVPDLLSCLGEKEYRNHLDISSPRLLPLWIIQNLRPDSTVMLNPDQDDLEVSKQLFNAAGHRKVGFYASTLNDFQDQRETQSFDLITSISVFEHIEDDAEAVRSAWRLLAPGGVLIVTLPCANSVWEQYINQYDYGVLQPDSTGYTFWQRFYNQSLLNDTFYKVCGAPYKHVVYGEKVAGTFYRNTCVKRSSNMYPYWMEPWYMARQYGYFEKIEDLPGEGVIALVFRKPNDAG
jgi:SAM-dependent methyltransferase